MQPAQDAAKYDPNAIRQAAEEKFQKHQDIEGAQMIYASALLDWVDDAREGVQGVDSDQLREAIATLWLSYAHLNQRAKQFKSATEVYEGAVTCPVAGSVGRVWLDYARFAEERDKMRTAQKLYLRALVGIEGNAAAVTDEQDVALLWQEFLDMTRRVQSNPNLTMKELKAAAEQQKLSSADATTSSEPSVPEQVASNELFQHTAEDSLERPEKRPRLEETQQTQSTVETTVSSKTYVVTAEAIEAEATDLAQPDLPSEISAAWYVRDGDAPPAFPDQLFSPSPPKLSDPTGKDLLGEELALALMDRLLKKDDQDKSGTVLLEVCRGCWMLTALKEKEASKSIGELDKAMMTEMDTMESTLDARLSVAGAFASAIQQMNENERNTFQQSCYQRRQELLTSLAWEFRRLLCLQQLTLTKLQVPGFEGPSVDTAVLDRHTRICSYLHSAFYLRQRIGEGAHEKMLQSQAERLLKEAESAPTDAALPLPPPPPPAYSTDTNVRYGYAPPPPPPQQGFMPQQPPMGFAGPGMVPTPPQYNAMPPQAYGQQPPPNQYYPPPQQ